MVSFRDHHTHLVLATLQACTVLGGALLTGVFSKVRSDWVSEGARYHYTGTLEFLLEYTRFWGFTFLVIPAAWTLGGIWLERRRPELATRERVVTSGALLLVGLIAFFFWLVFSAAAPPTMGPVAP